MYSISLLTSIVLYHHLCAQDHVHQPISTERSKYCYTGWPVWHAKTPWWQFRIIGKLFTNCHRPRQSVWQRSQSISSATWVWLPAFTAAISRHSAVLSALSIQHDTVRNQPPVQAMEIEVMGHSGNDMTSTKGVMVGLKCSPLQRFQDKCRQHEVHRVCLQDCWKIIQSIGQHRWALIVHLNHLPAHQGDPWLAYQWKDSSRLQNCGEQMSQELHSCLHCQRCRTISMMQMMIATICRTWVVQNTNC